MTGSRWVRNDDGSIQPRWVQDKSTYYNVWDRRSQRMKRITIGSEEHEEIKRRKKNSIKLRSNDVEIPKETSDAWYRSEEWKNCRDEYLKKYYEKNDKRICNCCKKSEDEVVMNVDHIYPVRRYWDMRLNHDNLQNMCADCNKAKGNFMEEFVSIRVLVKKDGEWVILELPVNKS